MKLWQLDIPKARGGYSLLRFWCGLLKPLLKLWQCCLCFMFWFFWLWGMWDLAPQPEIEPHTFLHWKAKSLPLDHQGSPMEGSFVISEELHWLLFSRRALWRRGQEGISCIVRERGCWPWTRGAHISRVVCADSRYLLVVELIKFCDVGSQGQRESRLAYELLPPVEGRAC